MPRFRASEHIRRRAEFEQVYQSGSKINGRFMTVFVRPNVGLGSRLGIAATRKIGGAVVRNRAKRLARELFRHLKPAADLDIVVIPRRELVDALYPSLEAEFAALLDRARKGSGRGRGARPDSRV